MHAHLVTRVPIRNSVQKHAQQEHIWLIQALIHVTVVTENVQI
jgi:hypothetical protein